MNHLPELAAYAISRGLAIAVKRGRVQFQHVTYAKNGTSTILPVTDWMSVSEAVEIMQENVEQVSA